MADDNSRSVLLIGESNAGKTHYGAQFLKRLIVGGNALSMMGASNLTPYSAAMESLADGKSTGHTPTTTYSESVWTVAEQSGHSLEMVWPDYGGEQIRNLVAQRKVPSAWRDRVLAATDWLLLIRLHSVRAPDDLFSRPLESLGDATPDRRTYEPSDQARTIELLQMLLYVAALHVDQPRQSPSLTVLLSCWDELGTESRPHEVLQARLPMLASFIFNNWTAPTIMGLSALEKPLSTSDADTDYAVKGPENFGYVILPDGTQSPDITLPVQRMLG